ncbi:hypothetical protein IFM89_026905 [Coptis chinensis]|uniref:WD repeat-containing protein 44 n=1 Tax=Coptis chinensis TaxID=261450 RepID=A0A835MAV4_9MAGN|nr:hypothetical protein IFM89_026905 [Coptis chinensis]
MYLGVQQLLSSSMDKTVRLWDMETKSCLKLFAHNDYVTCIQFHPMDDSYFISGSLDAKVRIWSIPERKVVDWSDLHEMVTAVCYTPDGQVQNIISSTRIVWCISGFPEEVAACTASRVYSKLHQKGQIDVQNKKKSQAKKITGFEFAPGNSSEVLITSADSRVRIFDGSDITCKFRGFRNTSSQISASFTTDGKYIVSASEDSQVYVWKRDEIQNAGGGKGKGSITTQSYERFQCRDVSVAIPWPGSTKYEPSLTPLQSKTHSRNLNLHPFPSPTPLTLEEAIMRTPSIKKNLPPCQGNIACRSGADMCSEDELPSISRTNSGLRSVSRINSGLPTVSRTNSGLRVSRTNSEIGDSASFLSASASTSFTYRDSPSISASETSYSSLSWLLDGGSNSSRRSIQATAWGLVVVTAGLGGEIRIYQNFGLPVRVGRQTNLFRDYTSGSIGNTSNKGFS